MLAINNQVLMQFMTLLKNQKSTASNIDKEAIQVFIAQLLEQKIFVNERSQTGKDS